MVDAMEDRFLLVFRGCIRSFSRERASKGRDHMKNGMDELYR
jgi:hypothetical protein